MKKLILAILFASCWVAQAANLILWLKLNDGSGSTATDYSGNGRNGTLINSPTWATGQDGAAGSAITFNGTDQGIIVSNTTSVADNPTALSVSFWVKTTHDYSSGIGNLVAKVDGAGWHHNTGWEVGFGDGNYIWGGLQYTNGGGGTIWKGYETGAGASSDGVWHHIALVISNSLTIAMYQDKIAQSVANGNSFVAGNVSCPTNNITIGWDYSGGYFQGTIDDVRLYDSPLTSSEVTALFNAGADAGSGNAITNTVLFSGKLSATGTVRFN